MNTTLAIGAVRCIESDARQSSAHGERKGMLGILAQISRHNESVEK